MNPYQRKPFSRKEYNDSDMKAYYAFESNCYPFILPDTHVEDYMIDVVLEKLVIDGKGKKISPAIGVELEYNKRWKTLKYPFSTVHLIASKVHKYTNYKHNGVIIPTFYLQFSENLKYCMIAKFGNIKGEIVHVHASNGIAYEPFVDASFNCIKVIESKNIGRFFYLFAMNKSTKSLWLDVN